MKNLRFLLFHGWSSKHFSEEDDVDMVEGRDEVAYLFNFVVCESEVGKNTEILVAYQVEYPYTHVWYAGFNIFLS